MFGNVDSAELSPILGIEHLRNIDGKLAVFVLIFGNLEVFLSDASGFLFICKIDLSMTGFLCFCCPKLVVYV